jgi:low affinity Fe/Cu permease
MEPERPLKLDSLGRYMQEQQAEYDGLEAEKQRLFREALERQTQARQAESRPTGYEQGKSLSGNVEVFGRIISIPPAEDFQDRLDLESGRPKTVYVWVMTASGWAYAGPLTVFQSETQAELDTLVTARFGGRPEEHIIVEAPDYPEASRLFGLLSRFEN